MEEVRAILLSLHVMSTLDLLQLIGAFMLICIAVRIFITGLLFIIDRAFGTDLLDRALENEKRKKS